MISAQEASAMTERSPTTWPASRPEWVAWLQEHRERFDGTMRRVRLGCRNEVNCRLCSPGALPAVSRLQPMRRSVVGKLPWAPRIFDGFYVLWLSSASAERCRFVFLAVRAASEQWAMPLQEVPGRGYCYEAQKPLKDLLQPLADATPFQFWCHETQVFKLSMRLVEHAGGRMILSPTTT
eukprot:1693071-Lingulodinium_polyedra.AAC.1